MSGENEPTRIIIERESDWTRATCNIKSYIHRTTEDRLTAVLGQDSEAGTTATKTSSLGSQSGTGSSQDQKQKDLLRREVRARVDKIVKEALDMSIPNLRVNGHNYEEYLECESNPNVFNIPSHAHKQTWFASFPVTEQFDESLDRHLQALQREQVEWRSVVAERRRKAPDQVKALEDMLEAIREGLEWDEEMVVTSHPESDQGEEPSTVDPTRLPERHQESVSTYKHALQNLNQVLTVRVYAHCWFRVFNAC